MSRRLFHGQLADEIAGDDRLRAERLRLLARSLVDIVRDALVRDGMVRIHGFGTFRLVRMAPRRGINPRTGETIDIPARNRVIFRPARALRDRIEPDHPAAVPLAEPHESREARLGGTMADSPVAGGLPAAEERGTQRNYFPDRVAAAAMAEPTAHVSASAHPPTPRASGSREANLGGAMGDTPSAGRVITGEDNGASASAAPASGRAANDEAESAPRAEPSSPADATATPARDRRPVEEPPAPEPSAVPVPETRRTDDSDVPVLAEPVASETAGEGDAGEHRDRRRPAGPLLAGLILLLLALLLGWWLWPREQPAPVATPEPGAGVEESDTGATGATDAAGDETAAVPAEDAEQAVTEAPGQAAGTETPVTVAEEGEAAGTSAVSGESEGDAGAEGASVGAGTPEPEPALDEAAASAAEAATPADAQVGATPAEASSERIADYAAGDDAPVADTTATAATTGEAAAESAEQAPAAASPWFAGREYTVVRGDTLWDLSDRNYVNPYYWPHIWNHNESIANPDRIEIDQALWLPRLEGEPRSLTQADRRSIAEGYLRLYHLWQDTGAGNPQYALVGVRYFDRSVMPPELRNDPAAGRPNDALAAAFEALLQAEFPRR